MKDSRNEYQKRGLYVEVRGNDVARALRKLKKLINAEGVVKELRDKEYYEKPSLKRKKAKASARKRHLKELEKKNDI